MNNIEIEQQANHHNASNTSAASNKQQETPSSPISSRMTAYKAPTTNANRKFTHTKSLISMLLKGGAKQKFNIFHTQPQPIKKDVEN